MKTFLIVLVLINIYFCKNFDDYINDREESHEIRKRATTPRKYVHTQEELNLTKGVPTIDPLTCNSHPMAVFVYSSPESIGKYFEIREAIRSTWITEMKPRNVSVFFAIGLSPNQTVNKELEIESNKYHDIIQFKFVDDFYNRTLETIAILRWVNQKCPHLTHILKVDDDVMVNTQYLLDDLPNLKDGFSGHLWANKSVDSDPNSRYHIPLQYYYEKTFPKFVSGRAYIVSQNITSSLLQAIDSYKGNILDIEDVFITGIIPEANGIPRLDNKALSVASDNDSCEVCLLFRNYVIYHCSDSLLIQELWTHWMSTTKEECARTRLRNYAHTKEEIELTKNPVIDAEPCKDNHSISVFIHSSGLFGESVRKREAQRETWVNQLHEHDVNVYFVVGSSTDNSENEQLKNESITTKGILQFPFIEDIHNQTLKSIAILRWVKKNCLNAKYILKVDEEVVINTKKFLEEYNSLVLKPGIGGHIANGSKPVRNRRSELYMPHKYYANDTYPDYLYSPTYIMENSITPALLTAIDTYSGNILDIEEVFMTGILPKENGVPIYEESIEYLDCSDVCPLLEHLVVSYCSNKEQIDSIWSQWKTTSIDQCIHQNNTQRKYSHTKEEIQLTKAVPSIDPLPCNDVSNISVFIDSKPHSSDKRQALRRTWVKELKRREIPVYFALGLDTTLTQEVKNESDTYHDIIEFPFVDDYYNRTLKAISIIRWVNKKCQTSEHILKVDDSVIVNTKYLLNQLSELKEGFEGFGDEHNDVKVERNPNRKWFIPKDYYKPEIYPFFVREEAYIISYNITPILEIAIDFYPDHILDLEAPFITGILPSKNVNETFHSYSDGRFVFINKFDEGCAVDDVCKLYDAFVVFNCLNAQQILDFWIDWKTSAREECIKPKEITISSTTSMPTNATPDCTELCPTCPEPIQCPQPSDPASCPTPRNTTEPTPCPSVEPDSESYSVWDWIKIGFYLLIGILLAIIALLVIAFIAGIVGYGVYRVIDSFRPKDDVNPKQPEQHNVAL